MTALPLPQTAEECLAEESRLRALIKNYQHAYTALGVAMDAREWPEGAERPIMTSWQGTAQTNYQAAQSALMSPQYATAYAELLYRHAQLLERYGQMLEQQPRWIPVGERLPEEGKWVQVALTQLTDLGRYRLVNVAHQVDGKWRGLSDGERVTHWQDLPNLPDDETVTLQEATPVARIADIVLDGAALRAARQEEAYAETLRALRHIASLARRKAADAAELAAEGRFHTTTYDETVEAAEVLRRPSEIAQEALDEAARILAGAD